MRKQTDTEDTSPDAAGEPRKQKRTYRAPRLVVYGDLRRIALTKKGAAGDGKGTPATKLS